MKLLKLCLVFTIQAQALFGNGVPYTQIEASLKEGQSILIRGEIRNGRYPCRLKYYDKTRTEYTTINNPEEFNARKLMRYIRLSDDPMYYSRLIMLLSIADLPIDINLKIKGVFPLFEAVKINNSKIVAKLLRRNADPNLANNYGEHSLFEAVRNRNIKIVKMLLQKEADPGLENLSGEKAIDLLIINDAEKRLELSEEEFDLETIISDLLIRYSNGKIEKVSYSKEKIEKENGNGNQLPPLYPYFKPQSHSTNNKFS